MANISIKKQKINMMKVKVSLIALFALLFFAGGIMAQPVIEPVPDRLPPSSQVDKEFRPEYRRLRRDAEQRIERLRSHRYEIVLDELSQVPTLIQAYTATRQQNWGEQVLLPADLRQRVAAECTNPVVVKVTDTGGKLTHADLTTGQMPGSTYTGESSPEDGNGHALHCTGIIAARGIGLAWEMVEKGRLKFKPVKVLTDGGGGSFSWVANAYAVERAQDRGLRQAGTAVIYSGSFGGGTAIVEAVEKELEQSIKDGVYFVFANGNTGGPVNYPAMSPLAISTASLDQSMTVSSYSSRGPQTDNAMPGRNINSTYRNNTYAVLSGTSMATPFLTAAAAIALSKWGMARLPDQAALKAYLAKVATDIPPPGRDDPAGWGVVYIRAILDTPPSGSPPPPPPPPPPAGKVAAATSIHSGYVMRYTFQGENVMRLLQVKQIDLYVEAETSEASIDAARQWCDKYFPAHQIAGIPKQDGPEGGLIGAAYWAGQFLEFYAKNNGANLQVTRIVAADEQGRTFEVMGFDRAVVPESYDGIWPKLRQQ